MLKKLLKYDFAAIYKIWTIFAVAVVGMALITSFLIRFVLELSTSDNSLYYVLSTILTTVMSVGLMLLYFGLLTITPILCYYRYYKNFFSDEGYLTFTLPVSRKDLYLAKVVNTFIFSLGNVLVTVVTALVMFTIIPPATQTYPVINPVVFNFIGKAFGGIWEMLGGWTIAYALLGIVMIVLAELYNIGLIHLAVTVGATVAKKQKLLAGIGIYMAATSIISFVAQFFTIFSSEAVAGFAFLIGRLPDTQGMAAVFVCLLLIAVVTAVLAVILHFVTLNTIEKKLNLA